MEELYGFFYEPAPTYYADRSSQTPFDKKKHKKFNSGVSALPVI